jgi:hypothetical protein
MMATTPLRAVPRRPGPVAARRAVRILDQGDLAQLVRLLIGAAADPDLALALHRRTAGDPFQILIHLLVTLMDGAETPVGGKGVPTPVRTVGSMRHEGDYWTVAFRDRAVLVRDIRGLHYLAPLLRSPGRPLHVSELVGGARAGDPERARVRVTKGIGVVIERLRACHPPLADHLDATVRRGYFCRYLPDPAHPIAWEIA